MISTRASVSGLCLVLAIFFKPFLFADMEGTVASGLVANVAVETPSGNFLADSDGTIFRAQTLTDPNSFSPVYTASEGINGLGHDSVSTVVAVGDNGYIAYSSNGGDSWQAADLSEPILGDLHGVAYGNGTWVAVGSGQEGMAVLRSTDGAVNWTLMDSPGEGVLTGVSWNGNRFYAVGGYLFDGILLQSESGLTWAATPVTGDFAQLNFIVVDSTGAFLAGGESGTLVRSGLDGTGVQALQGDVSGDLTTAVTVADGHWLVGGPELLVLEVLAGQTPIRNFGPIEGAGSVDALLLLDSHSYLIIGDFDALVRPLELDVDWGGSPGLSSLRVSNLVWGERYLLQRSSDLNTWQVEESFTAAGLTQTWALSVPTGPQSFFYRVVPE